VETERESLKQQLTERVRRFVGGDADAVAEAGVSNLATRLARATTPQSPDYQEVVRLLGWLHLCLNGIATTGTELPDLRETAQMLAPVHQTAPQTLPVLLLVTVELIAGLPSYRKPQVLNEQAVELVDEGLAAGDVALILRAINVFRDALEASPPDWPDRAGLLTNVCSAWLRTFELTGDPSAVDHAVRAGRESIAALVPNDSARMLAVHNYGTALRSRYGRTQGTDDLDQAILLFGEAAELTPRDDAEWAVRQHNLGYALGLRAHGQGRSDDLDQTIVVLRRAADAIDAHLPEHRLEYVGDLAYFLWVRYERTGGRADLDESAALFRVAAKSPDEALHSKATAYLEAAEEARSRQSRSR
jgi:tetratricopeptide (TPR) repeat protein